MMNKDLRELMEKKERQNAMNIEVTQQIEVQESQQS